MIELVVFDADGVLFDSDRSNVAYYNAIFAQMDEPPLDRAGEICAISYAAEQVFAMRAGADALKLARMKQIARTLDSTPFFRLMRPPLPLRPFLLGLKRQYRLGLATNRSSTVPALVEHFELGGIFDAIASMLDRVAPKPAPDILRLCLERARVSPPSAVYVGDSSVDREAAGAAGMHFIAVGPRVEHQRRIASIVELPQELERLGV